MGRRVDGKRSVTMKTLACGDLVPGCPAVVTEETEEEILQIAAQHAVEAHGLTVDDGLVTAVKGAIREDGESA
jgi:predicted small metal-binding protein